MSSKIITLAEFETNPAKTLNDCLESGEPLVVEMPDHRLISIQTLEPSADDDLTSDLLASNADFRALVERSKASPRKPFTGTSD